MKKLKLSMVAVALLLSVGISFATRKNTSTQATYCSQYPDGQGWYLSTTDAGCKWPQSQICCFRVPDNFILYKPLQ